MVLTMLQVQNMADGIDEKKLIKELEGLYTIWIGQSTILDDEQGHEPWLPENRADINWDFWNRYRRYLEEEKGWSPFTVDRLEQLTDSILERLEYPKRRGAWDRRGMVVGQVQSGKTSNYTGLVCKAADSGYRLIIVLAGLHSSLRSQTQLRLDEGSWVLILRSTGRSIRTILSWVQAEFPLANYLLLTLAPAALRRETSAQGSPISMALFQVVTIQCCW
jgi:hypothetical protein